MNTENSGAVVEQPAPERSASVFNRHGVCESPDIVVIPGLPPHFRAEIRLALAADGWRVGFEYEGPPIGVSMRGMLPALGAAAFSDLETALAVGARQLIEALRVKEKGRKAAQAIDDWARRRGLRVHAGASAGQSRPNNFSNVTRIQ